MNATLPRFVITEGRRWQVIGATMLDDDPAYELKRTTPWLKGKGTSTRVARVRDCQPWSRSGCRRIKGTAPHRQGRPVVFEFAPPNTVTLRLKGKRNKMVMTLEGLYDMAARQEASNAKRERAWKKRQRQMGRRV